MPATTANLIAESVGSLLRQAREESGLDVHAVATRTKIPEKYIALFEDDAHANLADDVYTKIYLKAYGKFLGFDTGALVEHYQKERARYGIPTSGIERPDRHPAVSVSTSQLVVTPKVVQVALVALVAIGLLGWFGTEIKKTIAPPSIELASPQDGFVTYDRTVAIEGVTEKEVALSINGKAVSPDGAGKFNDTIDLQEGLNVITITGSKKHSKEMAVSRRVIVLPRDSAALPVDPAAIDAATLAPVNRPPAVIVPARDTVTAPAAAPAIAPEAVPVTATTPAEAPAAAIANPLGIQF
jgi:hypothetical protein